MLRLSPAKSADMNLRHPAAKEHSLEVDIHLRVPIRDLGLNYRGEAPPPAQFIKISIFPRKSRLFFISLSTCSSRATSVGSALALPPWAFIAPATASISDLVRAARERVAP